MNLFRQKLAATVMAVAFIVPVARAGEPAVILPVDPPDEDSWEFTLKPYFWFAGMEGDVGFGGNVADIDMSFSDIWDALDFGIMGSFEARKGKWGVIFDGLWLKLEEGGDLPGGFVEELNVEVEQARVQVMVSYRVLDGPTQIDLMAGAAWFYMSLDFELTTGPILPNVEGSESADFVDPVIGFSIHHDFNEKWFATLRGGVGGFGVNSDLTWQIGAMLGYNINERFTLGAGYRQLSVDYDDDDYLFDADMYGFFVGGAVHF